MILLAFLFIRDHEGITTCSRQSSALKKETSKKNYKVNFIFFLNVSFYL